VKASAGHWLGGLRDFLARYAAVFRAAWSARTELEPPARTADEVAFLPAHLELVETPVSPTARWTMRIVIALFCVALLWSVFGQLDIVAVAQGKTVAGSRTKLIQPSETAVVKRILVQDGQRVRKGDLLVELDATQAAADYAKAGEAWTAARLAELRFAALATALQDGSPPSLASDPALAPENLASSRRLVASQFDAYQAKRHNLQAAIEQRQAELASARALIGPLQDNARIATARAQDYGRLVKDQYVGRHEYLQREQERIEADRDLAAQRNQVPQISAALEAARDELASLDADMRQQTLDGLRQAQAEAAQYAPEVTSTRHRDALMQLRSPVDGTVQQLAIHTIGGVVTPAQPLLAVVPGGDALEIEATVLNRDIGFVRPGQRATVKIESFPYTRYGYLEGEVLSVSHDAAQDEKLGLVFPARVRLRKASLEVGGTLVSLTPGMSLSVEIKTGKRRVIDYLLSPLQQHGGEAFRER
jgi:hemolysin D